jgi:hypothetical protein
LDRPSGDFTWLFHLTLVGLPAAGGSATPLAYRPSTKLHRLEENIKAVEIELTRLVRVSNFVGAV